MNKDQIKGRLSEVAGKAQKRLGQALDSPAQTAKGMAREQKGKLEKTWGDAKAEVAREHRREASKDKSSTKRRP